jgi:transcriptional regulator with XRE-family HTH domain
VPVDTAIDLEGAALVRHLFKAGLVREARISRELLQAECAGAVGVDVSTWSYWERGERTPGTEAALRCLAVLGVLFKDDLLS